MRAKGRLHLMFMGVQVTDTLCTSKQRENAFIVVGCIVKCCEGMCLCMFTCLCLCVRVRFGLGKEGNSL